MSLLVFMLLPLGATAQQKWLRTNGPKQGQVAGIFSIGNYLLAGANGVSRSTNQGNTWGFVASNSQWANSFTQITDHLFALDRMNLTTSSDSGLTWSYTGSLDDESITSLAGNVFSAHGRTSIAQSSDFGLSWKYLSNTGYGFCKLSSTSRYIYGGTDVGGIFRSSDTGNSWQLCVAPFGASHFICDLASKDELVFANYAGAVHRSLDHGQTWTTLSGYGPLWTYSPIYIDGSTVYVGTSDGVYQSSDSGFTWLAMNNGLPAGHDTVGSLYSKDGYLFAAIGSSDYVWRYAIPPPPAPQPDPSYITPDAGAPGMCVAVEMVAPDGKDGYFGVDGEYPPDSIVRLTSPTEEVYMRLGPSVVSWNGKLIQQMIMIEPGSYQVPRQMSLTIFANGQTSNPFYFWIVAPQHVGVLTGGGSALGSTTPTARNTIVIDSMILQNGQYDLSNPAPLLSFPLRILSVGPIQLKDATLDVRGHAGVTNNSGGNGGPGGGGGGSGYSGVGGNGFTGGGGNNDNAVSGGAGTSGASTGTNGAPSINLVPGGDGEQHTSGSFNTGPDNGGGGGTGHPFGTSGTYVAGGNSPAGGNGGGSAGGDISSHTTTFGGGGGGYGTAGAGGGGTGDNSGKPVGNVMLIPIAGGSGGGAGNCSYSSFSSSAHGGSAGGGGGAIDLTSFRTITLTGTSSIKASGGSGSDASSSPAAGGGGGSGGAVMLSARDSIVTSTSSAAIDVSGGAGGNGQNSGGVGGRGRIRINGPLSTKSSNLAYFDASHDYAGPSIDSVKLTTTDFNVVGHCGVFDQPSSKPVVTVYWSWSSSTTWSSAQATVAPDPNNHTQKFTLAGIASNKPDDTELYVVAIQGETASNAPFTSVPSGVMSHTSGFITHAPPKVGKLAILQALDFGKVRKGTCKDSSFKLTNVGNGNLTITSQTFSDPEFKLISPPVGTVVLPGDTISVVLEFCPTRYGAVQSADTVHTTVGDSLVVLKGYTGKGKLAAIPVIDFGRVNVGDCKYDTITVSNIGDDTLVMNGNTNFAPPFFFLGTLTGANTFSLPPGASTQIVVKYCPTDTSLSVLTVRLDTIGPGDPSTYQLRGHGVQANVILDVTSLDLGCRSYGSFTQDYLSIFNRGNADDKIKSITITPPNFPVTLKVRDTNLVAGIHDTVVLTLNPQPGSPESGTITVVTESGATLTLTIKAHYSPAPAITALDNILKFDSVDVGDSAQMCLRITNYSCFSKDSIFGTIGAVGLGPDSAFHLTPQSVALSNRFGSLVDSAVDTFCVQFKPVRAGVDSTMFGVILGKTGQPTGYVKLIGIGRAVAVPVQLAIDSVYGRPGQTVNVFVRTLNDVTKDAITSVTFRVMFDPMQLDIKGATQPLVTGSHGSVPNSIEPSDPVPTPQATITEHRYSLGDRAYTVTYSSPLTGKAILATLPFEILMPSASIAPVRLASATFVPSTATVASKTDGAIVIQQCDTNDRMVYTGAPLTVIQNAPNPFNPQTIVPIKTTMAGHVTMSVYNSIGQCVMVPFDAEVAAGEQRVTIDGSLLASGAYRYITVWTNGAYTVRDAKTMIVQK